MVTVVKIGGNVINNDEQLNKFLKDFSKLPGKKILIHGGGKEATELSGKLQISTSMIEGRRVTDRATLDIVTMVYAGLINKRIVCRLQSISCDAIGLTGADANLIPAVKRRPNPIDYGFVGDIDPEKINVNFIRDLLEKDYIPVICAICHDTKGQLLNCNADSIASAVTVAMSKFQKVSLVYCFEKTGILLDIDDDSSVVPQIKIEDFEILKKRGVISGGMLPKVYNAVDAIKKGVDCIRICRADSILSDEGTFIKP